ETTAEEAAVNAVQRLLERHANISTGHHGPHQIVDADGHADADAGEDPADEKQLGVQRHQRLTGQAADHAAEESDTETNENADDALEADRVEHGIDEADGAGHEQTKNGGDQGGAAILVVDVANAGSLGDAPTQKGGPAAQERTVVDEQFERHLP